MEAPHFVDDAAVSNSPDPKPFIETFGITAIVHGGEWNHDPYLRQICVDEVNLPERGVELVNTPYYAGESASGIIARIAAGG